jgi:hypothetical protein
MFLMTTKKMIFLSSYNSYSYSYSDLNENLNLFLVFYFENMIVLVLIRERFLMRMFFHLFFVRPEECSLIGFLTLLNRMINRKIRIDEIF